MSKVGTNSDALNAQLISLDAVRKNANKVLSKINAQHEKARAKGAPLSEKQVEKLRGLYEQAYSLSQDERQVALAASELVSDLMNIGKRKSEGGGNRSKKRRTAVQQHPITEGAMVAANNEGQWILGRVQEFDFSSQIVRHQPVLLRAVLAPLPAATHVAHRTRIFADSTTSRTWTSPSSRQILTACRSQTSFACRCTRFFR